MGLNSNKKTYTIRAYLTGCNNKLEQFMDVLIKGDRRKDLISLHAAAINGARDLPGTPDRKTARSKYGVKKNK